jgi:hypothetical protein
MTRIGKYIGLEGGEGSGNKCRKEKKWGIITNGHRVSFEVMKML